MTSRLSIDPCRRLRACVALLAVAVTSGQVAAEWEWANPRPQGNDISAIAGNGLYTLAITGTAGGGHGLLGSHDGAFWHARTLPPDIVLVALAWSGDAFIGVGKDGAVAMSPNGFEWERTASLGAGRTLMGIAWGNGRYVAVGSRPQGGGTVGVLASSADGRTWVEHGLPIEDEHAFHDVTFAHGQFVLAGGPLGIIATSPDGMNWTRRAVAYPGMIQRVVGCAGRFVAVGTEWVFALDRTGDSLTSTDGINWSVHRKSLPTTVLSDLDCHDDIFAVAGGMGGPDSYLARSSDGVNWSTLKPDTINAPLALAWDGARFVAGGELGYIAVSSSAQQWITRSAGHDMYDLNAITWSGSKFVAVGLAGTILHSNDGHRWARAALDPAIRLDDVVHGGETPAARFVAVGSIHDDISGIRRATIQASADGAVWQNGQIDHGPPLLAVAWGDGHYVAVGEQGNVQSSNDGVQWTTQAPPWGTPRMSRIVHGAGVFVALGTDSVDEPWFFLVSSDGENWTRVEPPLDRIADLVWNGSAFLATTRHGRSLRSTNGLQWSVLDGPPYGEYERLAWNGREYRAVAGFPNQSVGVSQDGVHWTDEDVGSRWPIAALAGNAVQWVAVGFRAIVLTCGDTVLSADFD